MDRGSGGGFADEVSVSARGMGAGLWEFPDGSIAMLVDGRRPRPVRFLTFLDLFSSNG